MKILQDIQARLAEEGLTQKKKPETPAADAAIDQSKVKAALSYTGLLGQTRVSTSFGDVPAQLLRVRDMVRSREGTFVQIRHIEKIMLDEEFLAFHPEAHPIRVRASAFGPNRPNQDILFAPGQKVQSDQRSHVPQFEPAINLATHPKIGRFPTAPLTYYVIDCGKPTTILAERLWVQI